MALTLQRKLELAGDLSRVQPLLRRLHVVEKPKQRHHVRNVMLASSAIAAGVAYLVVARHRSGCKKDAVVGNGDNDGADTTEISEWPPSRRGKKSWKALSASRGSESADRISPSKYTGTGPAAS